MSLKMDMMSIEVRSPEDVYIDHGAEYPMEISASGLHIPFAMKEN